MKSEWRKYYISDVAEFLNHKRIPIKSLDRDKRQGKYPYYGASGIIDHIDDYIFDGTFLLVSEDSRNLRTRNTPIAFKATGKFWVNDHAHILAEKEEGILDYLEYYFSKFDINPYITGASPPKLTKSDLNSIEINIPPKGERLAINNILNSFTNKIKLNRQINQTLDQITQAVFKNWFVDSEVQEWGVVELGEMLEFNPKRTLKKGSLAPYLDMKNAPTQGHLVDNVYLREMTSRTKFINGDTLLPKLIPCLENGKTAYVDFLEEDQVAWGSTEYIVMRPRNGRPLSLGYIIARLNAFRTKAIQTITGTVRQRVDVQVLSKQLWVDYPMDMLNEFDSIASCYLIIAKSNKDQNNTLIQLRDTLLPKLLGLCHSSR